ncbi:MAG: isoprenylcysteine carboxylmethyltransferase family protein [Acidobacteriota bacterium]|nr:isoprenylcysteine carboxylmethyltransferase family protein [Acidobacteriota bacterium]
MSQETPENKGRHLSSLVFANRRFVSSGALVICLALKWALGGRSTFPLWAIGAAIVVFGLLFRVYSAAYLCGRHIVTKIEAEELCVSGPFAHVRNPLYIGNFIIGVGCVLAFNEWYGYAAFGLEFGLMYSVIIPYEERFLSGKFGQAYDDYKAATSRFFPRLKAYPKRTETTPLFGKAALGEKFHALVLAAAFALLFFLFVR